MRGDARADDNHMSRQEQPIVWKHERVHPRRVALPVAVTKVTADCTPEARAARIEGSVKVKAHVNADGTVSPNVTVERSLDSRYGLDAAAVAAAAQWRFSPATRDGVAVETDVLIEIEFRLDAESSLDGEHSRLAPNCGPSSATVPISAAHGEWQDEQRDKRLRRGWHSAMRSSQPQSGSGRSTWSMTSRLWLNAEQTFLTVVHQFYERLWHRLNAHVVIVAIRAAP